MLTYSECKSIAQGKALTVNAIIDKAYSLGGNYVFDTKEEYIGIFPIVVDTANGNIYRLWQFLNEYDMSMDDMQEVDF